MSNEQDSGPAIATQLAAEQVLENHLLKLQSPLPLC